MADVDPRHCPLCGGPNACAMANRCGDAPCTDCWCMRTTIDAGTLARIPSAARGVACVCARCAAVPQPDRPAQDVGRGRA